jgi:hypothetical protein
MSNYPNMSYCMCENTVAAMRQVIDAMQEQGPMFLQEMSRDEKRSFQELFNMSEDFIRVAEDLECIAEESDGQPDEAQEWESFDPDC